MGDPRKLKKRYERPKMLWDKSRIDEEKGLVNEYGLKNMRELWKANTQLRKIRRQVRGFLVLGEGAQEHASELMKRLKKLGIIKEDATIDDVLGLDVKDMLDRRLQTIVYKKGMAMTMKQSRQLITHGFIKINGSIVKSPGYMIGVKEEVDINYTKPINIKAGIKTKDVPEELKQPETKVVEEAGKTEEGDGNEE